MVAFDNFIIQDGSPIYMQIIRHIKRGIAAGTVRDRDDMPSRRVLSALLGVNPNTVQKAYRLLEDEGLIESHTGAKSVIVTNDEKLERIRAQLLENDAKTIVCAMKQMGISKAEALALIEKFWE